MSLKNLPYQQNKLILQDFVANNNFTIQEGINTIVHQVDPLTGEYKITDINNNNVLSVSLDGTLSNDSYIKSHIVDQVNPISNALTAQTVNLSNARDDITALQVLTEQQVGLITGLTTSLSTMQSVVPTDQNFTNLTNQVNAIQTYMNNLKSVFSQLNTIIAVDFSSVMN